MAHGGGVLQKHFNTLPLSFWQKKSTSKERKDRLGMLYPLLRQLGERDRRGVQTVWEQQPPEQA